MSEINTAAVIETLVQQINDLRNQLYRANAERDALKHRIRKAQQALETPKYIGM